MHIRIKQFIQKNVDVAIKRIMCAFFTFDLFFIITSNSFRLSSECVHGMCHMELIQIYVLLFYIVNCTSNFSRNSNEKKTSNVSF